jgi:transcriptional regulator with XRE-family HTH domain
VDHKRLAVERDPIEPVYVQLGKRVALARRSAGLTQVAAAQRAAMGRPTLANIEKGRQRVLYHQLLNIALALGLGPCELLPAQPTESEALDRLDTLDYRGDVLDWARRGLARTGGDNRVIDS